MIVRDAASPARTTTGCWRSLPARPPAGRRRRWLVPVRRLGPDAVHLSLLHAARPVLDRTWSSAVSLRAISACVDDPRGDFILTAHRLGGDDAVRAGTATERRQIARERLEGDDAPDVLQTGEWAGLPDIDYVVLSARRKAEWTAGAIILTSSDWYRLGVPFDIADAGRLAHGLSVEEDGYRGSGTPRTHSAPSMPTASVAKRRPQPPTGGRNALQTMVSSKTSRRHCRRSRRMVRSTRDPRSSLGRRRP